MEHHGSLFIDIKFYIISIIEGSNERFFVQLKQKLMHNRLVFTPEERTIGKRYRLFINRCAKQIEINNELELLIQKNLLLLDLGIVYLFDHLLEELVSNYTSPSQS